MNVSSSFRDAFLGNLQSGLWGAGERLPAERELSEQFKISRSSVRKVLHEMRGLGLITQTVGSGTYVSSDVATVLQRLLVNDAAQLTSPGELMAARLALEPAVIGMVIAHASSDDFASMDACCAKAEAAPTLEEFEHWDGMLHQVIAGAAHNAFVLSVFKLMNQVRAQGEWGILKKRSVTPERRLAYQDEHRQLVAALRDRDQERAKALMVEHLLAVRRNLLGF
jgi:DNA-binding FadR family transcriptional regulator